MATGSLTDLLSQLNVQSTHNEHSQVEETSIQLLENGCTNPGMALKYCLIALIQQDKYNKALSVLNKYKAVDTKYGNQLKMEKLYIYYKLNNVTKFEKLYSSIVTDDIDTLLSKPEGQIEKLRGVLHVRAQFCYKNGQNDESYRIYNYLASHNSTEVDNTTELACNERVPLTVEPNMMINYPLINEISEDSYDILFNEAIVLAAQDKYKESLGLLEKSYNIAKASDYQDDINTIELQLSYVHQLLGNTADSKEYLNNLLKRLESGSQMHILAKNNLIAFQDFSKYKDNINLLMRELNIEKQNGLNIQSFTHDQWTKLNSNAMFLKLFNNVAVQPHLTRLSRTLHNYTKIVDNINLEPYQTQSKKLYHFATKAVNSSTEGSTIGAVLLTVQLLTVENEWDNAIRLSELFFNKSITSNNELTDDLITIVYVLFELYNHVGRTHSKSLLLKKTNELFNSKDFSKITKSSINKLNFWKHIAFQYLTLSKSTDGRKIFKQLINVKYFKDHLMDENIQQILNENNEDSFDFASVSNLVASVDVPALISSGITPLGNNSNRSQTVAAGSINRVMKKKLAARKEKKKQAKLQKFLATHDVTNKSVDLERWLPLKDRSTYRPKKKQLAKQTQGGAMNKQTEQALDISKKQKKNTNTGSKKKVKKGRK
ncbi:similar to Saccharomyces cerevisiae YPL210C SRP72 Core component of the signal recognition particle (SRP) ribonucleoprotein (RNP) complex [Maudiozyma saulgeensis]|uniref:Signal recognition particle subunit SRP72 n=1 Tax=Maudiozyma saulgeensis TaxID=1789683 RepID=A0A1X7R7B6_9SACH|nr:similar to Saccharomyces cerevisiae YPL210C SRP72 Core component of the signal recognition particle (SRP) ribonucleoprotein (RNP) complex [Kazachstania saulgeensis]